MNRRSFFGWIGSALAGCVLSQTPLAGKYGNIMGPLDALGGLGPWHERIMLLGGGASDMWFMSRKCDPNDWSVEAAT